MQFSNVVEDSNNSNKKLYLGLENFSVTAFNPTMAELNDMGINVTEEPVYNTKVKRDFGDGEKEYDAVNLRFYLSNHDSNNPIKTQVNYQVVRSYPTSSSGKTKCINKYGTVVWMEDSYLNTGTVPANYQHWYVNEGVHKCYRGEDTFVQFLKAFLNLPTVKIDSNNDIKTKGLANIDQSDWDKLFAGNFTEIRKIIHEAGDAGKLGFLLGVRTLEDGRQVQALFASSPLKRYVKSMGENAYLVKDVANAQANGAYSTVIFDLDNLVLREFDPDTDMVTPDDDFPGIPVTMDTEEDHDDLPF